MTFESGRSPPGAGLTFTLLSTMAHWPLSAGMRWASSTVALSEIVVMSEFNDPSSEVAAAANGRAARSSTSASDRKRVTSAADVDDLVESS